MHCQKLSQNGHRGTPNRQTQDQNKSFSGRQHKTNYFILLYLFILLLLFCFHKQTLPQFDHLNKNLLRGTNNSKMLLGGNTAGRETHEPTTRKRCATNKLKISGKRGPNWMIKAVIDLFGILINQDFFISLVDVNKDNEISVLAGVSHPTPYALFALLARPESPSPFLSKACHAD